MRKLLAAALLGALALFGGYAAAQAPMPSYLNIPSPVNKEASVVAWCPILIAGAWELRACNGALNGAPVVSAQTSVGTTPAQVFPAVTARYFMRIQNLAAAGGASAYCTDDGSTPSATNASFVVAAQGSYTRDVPAFVPNGAVSCMAASTINIKGESY